MIHQPIFPVRYSLIVIVKLLNILQDIHNNIQDKFNGILTYQQPNESMFRTTVNNQWTLYISIFLFVCLVFCGIFNRLLHLKSWITYFKSAYQLYLFYFVFIHLYIFIDHLCKGVSCIPYKFKVNYLPL